MQLQCYISIIDTKFTKSLALVVLRENYFDSILLFLYVAHLYMCITYVFLFLSCQCNFMHWLRCKCLY